MFEVLFSRSLFGLIAVGCVVIISSTAVILVSEYPEPLFVLILVTVFAVYLTPNYRGDIIAVSYERVGLSYTGVLGLRSVSLLGEFCRLL